MLSGLLVGRRGLDGPCGENWRSSSSRIGLSMTSLWWPGISMSVVDIVDLRCTGFKERRILRRIRARYVRGIPDAILATDHGDRGTDAISVSLLKKRRFEVPRDSRRRSILCWSTDGLAPDGRADGGASRGKRMYSDAGVPALRRLVIKRPNDSPDSDGNAKSAPSPRISTLPAIRSI